MQDKTLTCRDCGTQFTFTAQEQEFYASKRFTNEPGRCSSCREAKKRANGGATNGADRGSREMFPAVCAQCGKQTQVPFEPRSGRPVYCSDCFRSRQGEASPSFSRGNR